MSEFIAYKCKYCGKENTSKKRLLSLKCPSHPRGQWHGMHVLDSVAEFVADTFNGMAKQKCQRDKILAMTAEDKEKAKPNNPFSNVQCLGNINLNHFSTWMINNWESVEAQDQRLTIVFAFGVARDTKIPAGEIDASWAQFFNHIQVDIEKKDFWQEIYWITMAEYDLEHIPFGQKPKTLENDNVQAFAAKIKNNWKDENTQNIVKGFSYSFTIFHDRTIARIIDKSWSNLFENMKTKILNVETWEKLFWICRVELY